MENILGMLPVAFGFFIAWLVVKMTLGKHLQNKENEWRLRQNGDEAEQLKDLVERPDRER